MGDKASRKKMRRESTSGLVLAYREGSQGMVYLWLIQKEPETARGGERLQCGMLSKEKECPNVRESKFWSRIGKIAQTDPQSFVCRTKARKQPCNEMNVSNFRLNLLILCFLSAAEGRLGQNQGEHFCTFLLLCELEDSEAVLSARCFFCRRRR